MIAALALGQMALPEPVDFDALATAIGSCSRTIVTAAITAEEQRHSRFLLDAYKEQRAIAAARGDLAQRRFALRSKASKADTEEGLTLAYQVLDDRTRALADQRALDQSEQDMATYFRTQYLRQCSGKGL